MQSDGVPETSSPSDLLPMSEPSSSTQQQQQSVMSSNGTADNASVGAASSTTNTNASNSLEYYSDVFMASQSNATQMTENEKPCASFATDAASVLNMGTATLPPTQQATDTFAPPVITDVTATPPAPGSDLSGAAAAATDAGASVSVDVSTSDLLAEFNSFPTDQLIGYNFPYTQESRTMSHESQCVSGSGGMNVNSHANDNGLSSTHASPQDESLSYLYMNATGEGSGMHSTQEHSYEPHYSQHHHMEGGVGGEQQQNMYMSMEDMGMNMRSNAVGGKASTSSASATVAATAAAAAATQSSMFHMGVDTDASPDAEEQMDGAAYCLPRTYAVVDARGTPLLDISTGAPRVYSEVAPLFAARKAFHAAVRSKRVELPVVNMDAYSDAVRAEDENLCNILKALVADTTSKHVVTTAHAEKYLTLWRAAVSTAPVLFFIQEVEKTKPRAYIATYVRNSNPNNIEVRGTVVRQSVVTYIPRPSVSKIASSTPLLFTSANSVAYDASLASLAYIALNKPASPQYGMSAPPMYDGSMGTWSSTPGASAYPLGGGGGGGGDADTDDVHGGGARGHARMKHGKRGRVAAAMSSDVCLASQHARPPKMRGGMGDTHASANPFAMTLNTYMPTQASGGAGSFNGGGGSNGGSNAPPAYFDMQFPGSSMPSMSSQQHMYSMYTGGSSGSSSNPIINSHEMGGSGTNVSGGMGAAPLSNGRTTSMQYGGTQCGSGGGGPSSINGYGVSYGSSVGGGSGMGGASSNRTMHPHTASLPTPVTASSVYASHFLSNAGGEGGATPLPSASTSGGRSGSFGRAHAAVSTASAPGKSSLSEALASSTAMYHASRGGGSSGGGRGGRGRGRGRGKASSSFSTRPPPTTTSTAPPTPASASALSYAMYGGSSGSMGGGGSMLNNGGMDTRYGVSGGGSSSSSGNGNNNASGLSYMRSPTSGSGMEMMGGGGVGGMWTPPHHTPATTTAASMASMYGMTTPPQSMTSTTGANTSMSQKHVQAPGSKFQASPSPSPFTSPQAGMQMSMYDPRFGNPYASTGVMNEAGAFYSPAFPSFGTFSSHMMAGGGSATGNSMPAFAASYPSTYTQYPGGGMSSAMPMHESTVGSKIANGGRAPLTKRRGGGAGGAHSGSRKA